MKCSTPSPPTTSTSSLNTSTTQSTRKVDELVAYDGSVLVDRTAGQIGARCDSEAANTLTLNLAVEIMEGRRSVDDARQFYAETLAAYAMGRDAPYAETLQFEPRSGSADPDESMMGGAMMEQLGEKIKDLVGAGDLPGDSEIPAS